MAPRVMVGADLLERLLTDSFVAAASVGGSLVQAEERAALHQLVAESRRLGAVWADRPP